MKKEQILSNCVDDVLCGRTTVEDCLRQHPTLREELEPLVKIALGIKPGETVLSSDSRRQIRSALVSAMNERETGSAGSRWLTFRPFTFRTAAMLSSVVLGVAVAGGGTVYASQRSLPGDVLYPVKTTSENVRLALSFAPETKADLRLTYAQKRVGEVASQARMGIDPGTDAEIRIAQQLDGALSEIASFKDEDLDEFLQQLSESSLHDQLTLNALIAHGTEQEEHLDSAMAVLRRSKLIADSAYGNHSLLETKPSVMDEGLEDGHFKIAGMLTSAEGSTWEIDGMKLSNVTYSGYTPNANSWVKAEGISTGGRVFVTSVTQEELPTGQATIEGKFNGTGEDGSVWYVGGVTVTAPQSVAPPSEGDELKLQHDGETESGSFSNVETDNLEQEGVDFEGALSSVDVNAATITIAKAGSSITVSVTEAQIRDQNRKALTLSQLQASVGRSVQARGLYREDGQLRATEIRLDYAERGEEGGD